MARALADENRAGKIVTIDVLPVTHQIYWNCVADLEGQKNRFELLDDYADLIDRYLIFLQGYSRICLRQLGLSRIHFCFLDAAHTYEAVNAELSYVTPRQKPGDVIVFDDYTPHLFPGVVRAVNEFTSLNTYDSKTFQTCSGRGYIYCVRK